MTKPDAAAQPWVAFFYSVVLEPQRRMKSVDLLEIARVARLARARTVLSTGNLIGWARGDERDLERRLERAAEAVVGKRIPVFCRSVPDFRRIVASNPSLPLPTLDFRSADGSALAWDASGEHQRRWPARH